MSDAATLTGPRTLMLPPGVEPHVAPVDDGLYADVLDLHYHQWEGCSQSGLKVLERSPAHLKAERDYPPEHGATKQENLDGGSAFHMATLQPDDLTKWFAVRPAGNANSNAYKDRVAAMVAENPFLRIIKQETMDEAERMRDAVLGHPVAGPLLAGDLKELSGIFTDPTYGVRCKIRMDAVAPEGLVDLKRTGDARKEAFGKIAHDLRYPRQSAFYLRYAYFLSLVRDRFFFIVCEGKRPHGVKVYRVPEKRVVQAEEEIDLLVERYGKCERTGVWPCYPEDIDDLWLPPWADRSSEELVEDLEEVA